MRKNKLKKSDDIQRGETMTGMFLMLKEKILVALINTLIPVAFINTLKLRGNTVSHFVLVFSRKFSFLANFTSRFCNSTEVNKTIRSFYVPDAAVLLEFWTHAVDISVTLVPMNVRIFLE